MMMKGKRSCGGDKKRKAGGKLTIRVEAVRVIIVLIVLIGAIAVGVVQDAFPPNWAVL